MKATDDGTPARWDEEEITVSVGEVNVAPVLESIGVHSVNEGRALTLTVTAGDVDQPANILSYSLDAASLGLGMTIDLTTGAFSWITAEAQGSARYGVTITVKDNGSPPGSDSENIRNRGRRTGLAEPQPRL